MRELDQPNTMHERVERLESILVAQATQVDCPVRNYFVPGMYAREMTIPAGAVLTGAVHKTEHLSTVSAGRILVLTDDGPVVITAPYTFVSKPGAKRAGLALETTVWTTYHATTTTDLDALVSELTESTAAELLGGSENKQLLAHKARELEAQ